MSTENKETKKEMLKIEVAQPADFSPIGDIEITTTELLAKTVNQILEPVFRDYAGCDIRVVPVTGRGLVLESRLYFKLLNEVEYKDENSIFAFVPASLKSDNKGSDEIISRLQRISLLADRNMNNRVSITDDAKSALAEFIVPQAKNPNGNVRWNECTNVILGANNTFSCVFKLDINRIVAKIYGEIDKDNTPLYYMINPSVQIGGSTIYGNQSSETWALNIVRVHHGEISKVSKMLGITVPSEYGMPQMVPAR